MVHEVEHVPKRPTSHSGVWKQQLVDSFSLHPSLTGVAIGILDNPQTGVEMHQHTSMSEFFFVLQGQGIVQVKTRSTIRNNNPTRNEDGEDDDKDLTQHHPIQAGSFMFVAPRQNHSFFVSEASREPLKLLYFGLTDD
ncbi:hypothetical protein ACA910_007344 [Epithemia clementina (nom. ined.)]